MVCVSVKTLAVKTFRINNKSKHFSDLLKGRTNISVGKGGFKFVIRKPMTRSSQFGCVRMSPELGGILPVILAQTFQCCPSVGLSTFPAQKRSTKFRNACTLIQSLMLVV